MVCKKYYLEVVIKELNSTKTYVKVNNDGINVVSRHLERRFQYSTNYSAVMVFSKDAVNGCWKWGEYI